MEHDALEALKRSAAIPSMPQVVTRFLEVLKDPDFKYQELVDALGADPGTVTDILRLANSSFFGVTRRIDSLRQAMTLLGVKRLRSLVIGRSIVEQMGKCMAGPIDISYFWRRSLGTAALAAKFTGAAQPEHRDAGFICGLLADIGVVIMADGLGDRYDDIARCYAPCRREDICELEGREFGFTHAEVSALVLEHWKLPESVCRAVAHHHDPSPPQRLPADVRRLARTVNGAGIIAKLLAERPDEAGLFDECRQAADLAGLELATLCRMLNELEMEVEELASVLNVDVVASNVYDLIAETIQQQFTGSR